MYTNFEHIIKTNCSCFLNVAIWQPWSKNDYMYGMYEWRSVIVFAVLNYSLLEDFPRGGTQFQEPIFPTENCIDNEGASTNKIYKGQKCGSCNKGFSHNAHKLFCKMCSNWFHIKYKNFNYSDYVVLVDKE